MIVKRKQRQVTLGVGPDEISEKDIGMKTIKSIIQNKININKDITIYVIA